MEDSKDQIKKEKKMVSGLEGEYECTCVECDGCKLNKKRVKLAEILLRKMELKNEREIREIVLKNVKEAEK